MTKNKPWTELNWTQTDQTEHKHLEDVAPDLESIFAVFYFFSSMSTYADLTLYFIYNSWTVEQYSSCWVFASAAHPKNTQGTVLIDVLVIASIAFRVELVARVTTTAPLLKSQRSFCCPWLFSRSKFHWRVLCCTQLTTCTVQVLWQPLMPLASNPV